MLACWCVPCRGKREQVGCRSREAASWEPYDWKAGRGHPGAGAGLEQGLRPEFPVQRPPAGPGFLLLPSSCVLCPLPHSSQLSSEVSLSTLWVPPSAPTSCFPHPGLAWPAQAYSVWCVIPTSYGSQIPKQIGLGSCCSITEGLGFPPVHCEHSQL